MTRSLKRGRCARFWQVLDCESATTNVLASDMAPDVADLEACGWFHGRRWPLTTCRLVVAVSLLLCVDATHAASITVNNFSFEQPAVGESPTSTGTVAQDSDSAIRVGALTFPIPAP